MTAAEFLTAVRDAGLHARLDGDRLFVRPESLLAPDLRESIRENRTVVVAALRRIDELTREYDRLLARFYELPDTREVVEGPEWRGTIFRLNELVALVEAEGRPVSDEEVVHGFGAAVPDAGAVSPVDTVEGGRP